MTYIVDLVGADDGINGTIAISFTEGDADARTATTNPVILDPMHFDGGDDDGIYDAYLKLPNWRQGGDPDAAQFRSEAGKSITSPQRGSETALTEPFPPNDHVTEIDARMG